MDTAKTVRIPMNIYVEYWKKPPESTKNTHAQMREQVKWIPPNPEEVSRRFCQNREQASNFASRMQEAGYYTTIKQDGYFYE